MSQSLVHDLTDCSEFRQTVLARPPAIVHGTAIVIAAVLAGGIIWAACTEAYLVVKARGRIRPMVAKERLAGAADEETRVTAIDGGQVAAVYVQAGDTVRRGDRLVQLDTRRLESDLVRHQRTIQTGEDELKQLEQLLELASTQCAAAKGKLQAELAQVQSELRQAEDRRTSAIRLAEVELEVAREQHARTQQLVDRRAATASQLKEAAAKVRQADLKLQEAQLAVEQGRIAVLNRQLELTDHDYSVKRGELEMQRQTKRGQVAAARIELTKLQLQQQQATLVAPTDGVVTVVAAKVGDQLEAGKPAVTMVENRGFRIDVAVSSDDVGELQLGMPVRVKLDAYDYQKYGTAEGTVAFIAPDSTVDESANDRAAVAYTVKIELDSEELRRGDRVGRLKLGMTGVAEIVVDRETLLTLVFRKIRHSISLN